MAYQMNVMDHFGFDFDVSDTVKVLIWLPDTCYVPMVDGREPYGDNYESVKAEGIDIKKSQQQWRINEVNRLRKEYTFERFVSEWRRKIEWLNSNEYIVEEY